MFGIVLADIESLDEGERARYAEVYCGVCHALKNRYGQVSRLCSNYDMAFAALLLESLFESGEERKKGRCALKPTKDHVFACGRYIDYAADMSVMLAYHKCIDDWIDEKSPAAFAAAKALDSAYMQVRTLYPGICDTAEQSLRIIGEHERASRSLHDAAAPEENVTRVEAIARAFGDIMAAIFSFDAQRWSDSLERFGSNIGRFVYFMDAAIDYDDDLHNGTFNPFAVCNTPKEDVMYLLRDSIGRAAQEFERLPLEQDLHLLRSVLYSGVWSKLSAQEARKEKHGK